MCSSAISAGYFEIGKYLPILTNRGNQREENGRNILWCEFFLSAKWQKRIYSCPFTGSNVHKTSHFSMAELTINLHATEGADEGGLEKWPMTTETCAM